MRTWIFVPLIALLATSARAQDPSPVDRSLGWLARQQNDDGSWSLQGKGQGAPEVASTGLAVLAFLGAGDTHKSGRYKKEVGTALRWLKMIQSAEGRLHVAGGSLRTHAIGALALIEAYGLTGSPIFRTSAQSAADYTTRVLLETEAAKELDAETAGWCLAALKSAKVSGLKVDDRTFERCLARLDALTSDADGTIGAKTAGDVAVGTAAATIGRVFGGRDPNKDATVVRGAAHLARTLPKWEGAGVDPRYVYFGSLATFQRGGDDWRAWSAALKDEIAAHQLTDGDDAGSWRLATDGSTKLGTVGSVAALAMALEVCYRYDCVFR